MKAPPDSLLLVSQLLTPEDLPKSFDFYRSFTQWIGGLSFVYLIMTFFYPEKKLAHMKGWIGGGSLKLKELLLTITVIFTIYTVILTSLLYLFGYESAIYNLSLIFSAVTGGGFIPTSTSLDYENAMVMFILMTGMIISALPFAFHYAVFSKEMHTTKMRPEIYTYFGIIIVSVIIFYFLIASISDIPSKLMTSIFHVMSASTNTGFQFIDLNLLSVEAKILLVIIMLIGGTAFSTAGGIKVGRILQIMQRLTKKRFTANTTTRSISAVTSRYHLGYNKNEPKTEKIKEEKTFRETLLIIVLFVAISFVTAIVLSYLEQKNFVDSLFESVSAVTTSGLTIGITSLNMDIISKVFLIFNMIAGRFEIIAIVYFFLQFSKRRSGFGKVYPSKSKRISSTSKV